MAILVVPTTGGRVGLMAMLRSVFPPWPYVWAKQVRNMNWIKTQVQKFFVQILHLWAKKTTKCGTQFVVLENHWTSYYRYYSHRLFLCWFRLCCPRQVQVVPVGTQFNEYAVWVRRVSAFWDSRWRFQRWLFWWTKNNRELCHVHSMWLVVCECVGIIICVYIYISCIIVYWYKLEKYVQSVSIYYSSSQPKISHLKTRKGV